MFVYLQLSRTVEWLNVIFNFLFCYCWQYCTAFASSRTSITAPLVLVFFCLVFVILFPSFSLLSFITRLSATISPPLCLQGCFSCCFNGLNTKCENNDNDFFIFLLHRAYFFLRRSQLLPSGFHLLSISYILFSSTLVYFDVIFLGLPAIPLYFTCNLVPPRWGLFTTFSLFFPEMWTGTLNVCLFTWDFFKTMNMGWGR